jgi:hypothetical protein
MGLASRDISVDHDGHEIALAVALTGAGFSTARYKLYLDGQLVDEQAVSVWAGLFGTTVILRSQLPPRPGQAAMRKVKVVAHLRLIRNNDYQVFVDDEQIHQEWATYGGV